MARYENPYLFLELEEAQHDAVKAPTLHYRKAYLHKLQEPYAYIDSFEGTDELQIRQFSSPARRVQTFQSSPTAIDLGHDEAITKEQLGKILDAVLALYKPHVARNEWAHVIQFRPEFLEKATRDSNLARRVAQQLKARTFSLMPGEKVEYNRAPAARIIEELKRLLV